MFGLSVIICQLLLSCNCSVLECLSAWECAYQNITFSYSVHCPGWFSCAYTTNIQSAIISCSGVYSCFSTTKINVVDALNCRRLYSCAFFDEINADIIHCYGDKSCFGSRIIGNNNDSSRGTTLTCTYWNTIMCKQHCLRGK